MSNQEKDLQFYLESLQKAEKEIEEKHQRGIALKDVVGTAFENHRQRIWTYFGFTVSKDKYGALFNVDWSIIYQGKLIAFEEDKGHYLDSCFLERAINGFSKTVNSYLKKNQTVPLLIIHSFTKYNLFQKKLDEDLETRKIEIKEIIEKKLEYLKKNGFLLVLTKVIHLM